jgi:predicted protein tyrosine phosphatase
MTSIIPEPLVVGYTCCGPTYRKSLYDKLTNYYFDDDNLFYCIVTDDKSYFNGIKRKNLVVNELKDFYDEFPSLEKNEYFLESKSDQDYASNFTSHNYRFPFSTYRFNIWQALKLNIKNVTLLCTDTAITFNRIDKNLFRDTNKIYNALSRWDANIDVPVNHDYMDMKPVVAFLENKYKKHIDKNVRVLDEAARLYIPNTLDDLKKLFYVWNEVIEFLYETKQIKQYNGSYVVHDEYILAPIYNLLGIQFKKMVGLFDVKHNKEVERFWM